MLLFLFCGILPTGIIRYEREQMLPTANGREKTCHFVFSVPRFAGRFCCGNWLYGKNEPETNGRRSVLNGRADY
ncbi:hypothetical protein CLOSTHATH_06365 [Hungatella hathewayi DSM 13479]|uniref:Uncharacterized protein n=1 Tax=Hungatella hathewayi DSM 13479 TaxID=566550 RepID=D3ARV9_9FIRM|nr:hypothetical protein CLOSTHATH_06365 [Hungatella hathewayi DSM 13479]